MANNFQEPLITCLCPTYKRPHCLQNIIACFESQSYENKRLVILDDADQYANQSGPNWQLVSKKTRYTNLAEKYNAIAEIAAQEQPEIYVVWEDDDIYLPHHLSDIAQPYDSELQFFCPRFVWRSDSKDSHPYRVPAWKIYHASWAFTRKLFEERGGYHSTIQLDFDLKMRDKFTKNGVRVSRYGGEYPSYVYRIGQGDYNGSQNKAHGYNSVWNSLSKMESPQMRTIQPVLDDHAAAFLKKWKCNHPE